MKKNQLAKEKKKATLAARGVWDGFRFLLTVRDSSANIDSLSNGRRWGVSCCGATERMWRWRVEASRKLSSFQAIVSLFLNLRKPGHRTGQDRLMDPSQHVYLADGAQYLNSQAFVLQTSSDLFKTLGNLEEVAHRVARKALAVLPGNAEAQIKPRSYSDKGKQQARVGRSRVKRKGVFFQSALNLI